MNEAKVRLVCEPKPQYEAVTSPSKAVKMVRELIGDLPNENCVVVNFNTANVPINYSIIAKGSDSKAEVSIKSVMQTSILSNANAIMLFHNHPSGNLQASPSDYTLTETLKKACEIMGISFLDHIILSPYEDYYSFKENGVL